MKAEIIYLKEQDYQGYYVAYLKVGGVCFLSSTQHTLNQWREILDHDLEGIPVHDR